MTTLENIRTATFPSFIWRSLSTGTKRPQLPGGYGTIVNGYSIAINTYKNGGQVSDRAKALVKDITDSIVFSEVKPMPSVENVPDWLWYSIIGFTALIVVVGTCQVFYNRA
ncbi:MAG: hypothetical protein ACLRXC_10775 [[Clostridium] leptum]